jgi:hypothetical protein
LGKRIRLRPNSPSSSRQMAPKMSCASLTSSSGELVAAGTRGAAVPCPFHTPALSPCIWVRFMRRASNSNCHLQLNRMATRLEIYFLHLKRRARASRLFCRITFSPPRSARAASAAFPLVDRRERRWRNRTWFHIWILGRSAFRGSIRKLFIGVRCLLLRFIHIELLSLRKAVFVVILLS